MKVVILEDERPALEQLRSALAAWDPNVEVVAELDSVRDAVRWLQDHPEPDVVLADIRLTDGRSMTVFERVRVHCPVLFVTAYDQYTQAALDAGGIDYLYKPVQADRLARALDKVLRLKSHFSGRSETSHRQRLLVRKGSETLAIPVSEVAWFCTEHRLVLAVLQDGRRHVVDRTLGKLADSLDPGQFFRTSRSWIVSIDAVVSFRSHGKGRLLVMLEPHGEALVSAERASEFRKWLDR